MLVCPFCQFENADNPQVCQQCGVSLLTWHAICLPHKAIKEPLSIGPCLGPTQRYRLSKPTAMLRPGRATVVRVVDSCPDAAPPLQALQTAWLDDPALDPRQSPLAQSVPPQAFPYLALQADCFPAVPAIHDAFYHDRCTTLLIEDRGNWPTLTSLWQHTDPDGWLQQVQWLFEITLLWEALTPWHLEATLLHTNRLRVDGNDLLCLSHLDPTQSLDPLPLSKLGESWQHLLEPVDGIPPALEDVVQALTADKIKTLTQLRDTLAALGERWSSSPAAPAGSPLGKDPVAQVGTTAQVASESSRDVAPEPSLSPWVGSMPELSKAAQDDADGTGVTAIYPSEVANDKTELPEVPTMVLPMKLVQVDEVGQTHVGLQRSHNEDYFFAQTNAIKVDTVDGITLTAKGLYIVCDGMGGHASGEVASQLAVETLTDYFKQHWQQSLPDQPTLINGVRAANQTIYEQNQAKATSGLGRMGTTLVMLLVHNLTAVVVHVGDSRLYSYSKRQGLRQLTLDHEVGQREINRGIEPAIAYARPDAYQLTQALGPRHQNEVKPAVTYHDIAEDTLFLLCSDGLSDNDLLEQHTDSHIAPLLSSRANLDNGLANLIDLANEKNGHDNITAIITRLKLRPDMSTLPR
jgi:protein phosphatase